MEAVAAAEAPPAAPPLLLPDVGGAPGCLKRPPEVTIALI